MVGSRLYWLIISFIGFLPCLNSYGQITVTNTNDSGAGSLRQAIIDANASTGETIDFNISGGGPWQIDLVTDLPNITQPTTIDGTTQLGWDFSTENMVTVDASGVTNGDGFNISSANVDIIGMKIVGAGNFGIIINGETYDNILIQENIINQNGTTAINIINADNITIQGNHIGVSGDGLTNQATSGTGIAASGSDNITIGGDRSAGEGNMISGSAFSSYLINISGGNTSNIHGNILGASTDGNDITVSRGIVINNMDNISIGTTDDNYRNFINGMDDDGALIISNADGLDVINNYIGIGILDTHLIGNNSGSATVDGLRLTSVLNFSIDGNVISGAINDGIQLGGTTNTGSIINNIIGLAPDASTAFGNTAYGINVIASTVTNFVIGGTGSENFIAHNVSGIRTSQTSFGSIDIQENSYFCNSNLGIDIAGTSVVTAPIITNITATTISGTSVEADGSTIDVYEIDAACADNQGAVHVGSTTVTSGTWSLSHVITSVEYVATVKDVSNGISEFSSAFTPSSLIVTNTNNSGYGSLREAVNAANSNPGADQIVFSPSLSGMTIPILTSSITISSGNGDATTINGDLDGDFIPDITIDRTGTGFDGIVINAANCNIEYLNIQGFSEPPRAAIHIDGVSATNNYLIGNYLGTDATGNSLGVANYTGIYITNGASDNFIGDGTANGRNIIGGNTFGIRINGSDNTTISGNNIGIGLDGDSDVGNSLGVDLFNSIGTSVGVAGETINIISYNSNEGLRLQTSTNTVVVNNYVGIDQTGLLDRGNGIGISVENASDAVQIGASNVASRNVIAGHSGRGIDINDSDDAVILGNYLGIGSDGSTIIPNGSSGPANIDIQGTSANAQIGDGTTLGRNIISGGGGAGIRIGSGPTNVYGNYIGTDASGTLNLGNSVAGITLVGGSGQIGGSITGYGNVISGNSFGIGVSVGGFDILGNYIGTNALGTAAIPNNNEGIRLSVGSGTNIGDGTTLGANFISGNLSDGILIENLSSTGNTINMNYIGVQTDGTSPLGNGVNGILIESQANGNAISSNVIANNTSNGIEIGEVAVTGIDNNVLTQNSIYNNGGQGILITNGAQNGVTAPVISSTLDGLIVGTADAGAVIEIFADASDEGEQYLDFTTADGGGNFSHQITVASINPGLTNISVTQTSASNTSEFANSPLTIGQPFITTWVPSDTDIQIPTNPTYAGSYNYDFTLTNISGTGGDANSTGVSGGVTIIGLNPGDTYQLEITGDFPAIYFNSNATIATELITIEQWGDVSWESMNRAFAGCTNLQLNAIDQPVLTNVTDLSFMFLNASTVNADVSDWDVSTITNMSGMFNGATDFNNGNQPLDWANTSLVQNLSFMFSLAPSFDQDISGWDVSSVTTMRSMFADASGFNNGGQPLNWVTTSLLSTTQFMFFNATSFDQSIGSWDVSGVTNMANMLDNSNMSIANYDATLIGWEAQTLQNGVQLGAAGVNYCSANTERSNIISIFSWTITDAGINCPANPFITTWSTTDGQLTIPTNSSTYTYNYDIVWTNLTNTGVGDGSITGQTGDYTITGLTNGDTYQIEITGTFPAIYFNNDGTNDFKLLTIEQWGDNSWLSMERAFFGCNNLTIPAPDSPDLSLVTDMSIMFTGTSSLNANLSAWDVSNVTNMSSLFASAFNFNTSLDTWDVSNVTDMSYMFSSATSFDQDLNSWNTTSVNNMAGMFGDASVFDGIISSWDVSNVTDMNEMFSYALLFNQNISNWNVGKVADMQNMFNNAEVFNQDISSWDVSMVQDMADMFVDAADFAADLSGWDVSSVTDMKEMFWGATSFNSDIGAWDVSIVTVMSRMFQDATSFNQDLNSWDVRMVTEIWNMFDGATSFNQSLATWDISGVNDMTGFLDNSGLSVANYDATLIGWNSLPTLQNSVPFGAAGLNYCSSSTERSNIISTYNWSITDAGLDCNPEIEIYAGADNSGTIILDGQSTVINLGTALVGNNLNQQFAIENTGSSDLSISSITTTGSNFSIIGAVTTVTAGSIANFIVGLSGASAGTFNSTVTIASDDADESIFDFPVTGTINASPTPEISVFVGADNSGTEIADGQVGVIDIGTSSLGTDITFDFTIENSGTSDLNVSDISFNNSTGSFDIGNSVSTVSAGGLETFNVILTAGTAGTFTADVIITNNDPDEGTFTFPISGTITGSTNNQEIEITFNGSPLISGTSSIDFGSGEICTDVNQTITIENTGTDDLVITDIQLLDGTVFSIQNLTFPITLTTNETLDLTITMNSCDADTFEDQLTILSNDLDEGSFQVALTGDVVDDSTVIIFDGNTNEVVITGQDIDLGQTFINVQVDKTFGIENLSSTDVLQILNITVDNPVFAIINAPTAVAPGGRAEFTVRLLSNTIGTYSAIVTAATNINNFSFAVRGVVIDEGNPPITVYNIVTPNGDGIHDFLKILNIEAYPSNVVSIFDRWGGSVFETTNYNNTNNYFVGISNNGDELITGNYYYVIDKGNGDKPERGFILLKR